MDYLLSTLSSIRLSLGSSFHQEAAGAVLDLDGDEGTAMKQSKVSKKWCVR